MLPLIPFAAGLLTGVVALRLFKSDKSKAALDKAQEHVRDATVSSLDAVSNASSRMRDSLTETAVSEEHGTETPVAAADEVTPTHLNNGQTEDRGER